MPKKSTRYRNFAAGPADPSQNALQSPTARWLARLVETGAVDRYGRLIETTTDPRDGSRIHPDDMGQCLGCGGAMTCRRCWPRSHLRAE